MHFKLYKNGDQYSVTVKNMHLQIPMGMQGCEQLVFFPNTLVTTSQKSHGLALNYEAMSKFIDITACPILEASWRFSLGSSWLRIGESWLDRSIGELGASTWSKTFCKIEKEFISKQCSKLADTCISKIQQCYSYLGITIDSLIIQIHYHRFKCNFAKSDFFFFFFSFI